MYIFGHVSAHVILLMWPMPGERARENEGIVKNKAMETKINYNEFLTFRVPMCNFR